jgi:hypothetical protein
MAAGLPRAAGVYVGERADMLGAESLRRLIPCRWREVDTADRRYPGGAVAHALEERLAASSSIALNWPATEGSRVMQYVVVQVILKEKLWGTGSGNLTSLEKTLNEQAAKGYRLHTITTASSGSKGIGGGDRIQATMVFESLG